jgi:hypothetical protein
MGVEMERTDMNLWGFQPPAYWTRVKNIRQVHWVQMRR